MAKGREFRIKIINGPDKSKEYKILHNQVSIGRAKENDIVIPDKKCSRSHMMLYLTDNGVQVTNISTSAPMTVNGEKSSNVLIEPQSIIQIGQTKIQVLCNDSISEKTPNLKKQPVIKKQKKILHMIFGALAILLFVVFLSDKEKEEETIELRGDKSVEREISSIQEIENALIRKRVASGKNSPQYLQARSLFIQGFRDYKEGQYMRAIDYFNGALAVFPNHKISARYLRNARTKLDEKIQLTLRAANQFYEQKKYKRAANKYGQVLFLVTNKNSKLYREASARKSECLLRIDEADTK